MASPRPLANPVDVEVTIVSAKHLKNVNWRHGELKPYAVVYLDPDRRFATKPDDSGSVKPVWNERITVPFPFPQPGDPPLILTVDVFHSKPSETPKPLVGSARSPLRELLGSDDPLDAESGSGSVSKTLDLRRPSGRPQGKIRIKIGLRGRPSPPESDYPAPGPAPPTGYLYSPVRDYRAFSPPPPPVSLYGGPVPPPNYPYASYPDPYYSSAPGYYSSGGAGYYSAPAPARPYYDRVSGYGGGPSAPVDYSSGPAYEQKARGGRAGVGAGLAVGAVTGALGAMTLDENLERWDGKVSKRAETDLAARDDYSDYRADH